MQKEIISLVYIMCIKHWGERKCNTKKMMPSTLLAAASWCNTAL